MPAPSHAGTASRPPARLPAVLLLTLLATCAWADEAADRLKLQALIEEAGLILDERQQLQPAVAKFRREGEALDAQESSVRGDSAALNDDIAAVNREGRELQQAVEAQRARCPKQSDDQALVEGCNAEAARLVAAGQRLEDRRSSLRARQQALNQRIEQQNASRREWALRKRELDGKLAANGSDMAQWLSSARPFLASGGFRVMQEKVRNPLACKDLPGEGGELVEAMQRAQACLRAVGGSVEPGR